MNSTERGTRVLQDTGIPVKIKLSALWASVMFCYIYGDFFGLFQPGRIGDMLAGKMEPLGPATQGVLLGVSAMISIPAAMVFLSLVLKPALNRWANVVLGAAFTVIMLMTMPGAWMFYLFLGCIEVVLTALIVWYAWTWPEQTAA